MISWVKRESTYGGSPVVTGAAAANDNPTKDLLTSLNARSKRIWRKADWKWKFEDLAIPMVVGQSDYLVSTVSGRAVDRISSIIPYDLTVTPQVSGLPLRQRTERQFYSEVRGSPNQPGLPDRYLNRGKDDNGNWRIRLWPAPISVFTMSGTAKGVLNTWLIGDVTGIAPFSSGNNTGAANPPLTYFPDGVVEDVLFEGMMADACLMQKNYEEAKARDTLFERKLTLLVSEEAEAARDNTPPTTPLPAVVRRRRSIMRGARRC